MTSNMSRRLLALAPSVRERHVHAAAAKIGHGRNPGAELEVGMRAMRDMRARRGDQRAILLGEPRRSAQAACARSGRRAHAAGPRAFARPATPCAQPRPASPRNAGAGRCGACGQAPPGADAVVAAALQIVQAHPELHAAIPLAGLEQPGIVTQARRKRLGIRDIGDDDRADADVARRCHRRLGAEAHIDDGGRAREQRLRIGRKRPDIGLLVGELRLLAARSLPASVRAAGPRRCRG